MQIESHRIEGTDVKYERSPNHGGKFAADLPDTIVIHYTAGSSAESSVRTLCNPRTKASAHLVIARDGSITQLVEFDTVAWHAGRSFYRGRVGLNKYSLGIEIDNAGKLSRSGGNYVAWFGRSYPENEIIEAVHRNDITPAYWHRYTEEQISTVEAVCAILIDTYGVKTIVGHEEISPGRKQDPGPAFPLDTLRERLLLRERGVEDDLPAPTLNMAGMVTASKLNIRSLPSINASKIAPPLVKGTMLEIIAERSGWYQVDVTMRGWVKKDYVKT